MLEKSKDYIEMRISSTECAFTRNGTTTISIEGFSYDTSFCIPDIGESYVIIPKEKFDQLQTDNKQLINEAAAWEDDYNHLLTLTGFDNEGEIEDFLEQNHDRNKLTTVIDDKIQDIYKWQNVTGFSSPAEYTGGWEAIRRLCGEIYKPNGDYDRLLELTGYKSEKDIRAVLVLNGEKYVYKTMRDYINSLKRRSKFTESNWQKATGCDTPEAAETTIRDLRSRIDKMKDAASIASNWMDKIVEG